MLPSAPPQAKGPRHRVQIPAGGRPSPRPRPDSRERAPGPRTLTRPRRPPQPPDAEGRGRPRLPAPQPPCTAAHTRPTPRTGSRPWAQAAPRGHPTWRDRRQVGLGAQSVDFQGPRRSPAGSRLSSARRAPPPGTRGSSAASPNHVRRFRGPSPAEFPPLCAAGSLGEGRGSAQRSSPRTAGSQDSGQSR